MSIYGHILAGKMCFKAMDKAIFAEMSIGLKHKKSVSNLWIGRDPPPYGHCPYLINIFFLRASLSYQLVHPSAHVIKNTKIIKFFLTFSLFIRIIYIVLWIYTKNLWLNCPFCFCYGILSASFLESLFIPNYLVLFFLKFTQRKLFAIQHRT